MLKLFIPKESYSYKYYTEEYYSYRHVWLAFNNFIQKFFLLIKNQKMK